MCLICYNKAMYEMPGNGGRNVKTRIESEKFNES
jgi:hypothetical protein